LWTFKVRFLAEGCPKVKGTTNRLFRPIVEVIAKGGPDLGFGLDSGDQCPVTNDEEIPFFGWSEETGKFDGLFSENATVRDSGLCDKFREEVNEAIHLCTACEGTT
jgi:hypothetical protein